LLTGNNWQLSARKITGDSEETVEWFAGDNKIFEKKNVNLSSVLQEIEQILTKSQTAKTEKR